MKGLEEDGAVWAQTANESVTTTKPRANAKRKAASPVVTEDSVDEDDAPATKKTKVTANTKKGIAKPVAPKKGKKAGAKSAAKVAESDSEVENGNDNKLAAKKGKGKNAAAVNAEPKPAVKDELGSESEVENAHANNDNILHGPPTPTTAGDESGASSPLPSVED